VLDAAAGVDNGRHGRVGCLSCKRGYVTSTCGLDRAAPVPCASPARYAGLAEGPHRFTVQATDGAGNVDPTPLTYQWLVAFDRDGDGYTRFSAAPDCNDTAADVRPGARDVPNNGVDENCDGTDAIDLDVDRDGSNRPRDCDDRRASIHPGAVDRPRNRVDEDCNGRDAEFPTLDSRLGALFRARGGRVVATTFYLARARSGSVLRVRCRGCGCSLKPIQRRIRRDRRRLNLLPLIARARFRAGARLEVRVTRPATIGIGARFLFRRGAVKRVDLCFKPRKARPVACV